MNLIFFYELSALVGCWSLVYIIRIIYIFVRNRCVIEVVGGVFVLSLCFWEFSVGKHVRAFVIGLRQIFSYFSL